MLPGMRPPCDQTGFMTAPRPTGWVQDDGRWGLWRNGLEIAAVQPDAKGVRVRLSCRKLWRDKEVRAASVAPGEVLCRAMVCRPGSGGCAAEGGCGATGRQRRTSPQALQHRDPAAETTGRDPPTRSCSGPSRSALPAYRRVRPSAATVAAWIRRAWARRTGRARRRPRYGSSPTTWTGITAATGGRGQLGGGAPLDCGLRLIGSNRSPSGWTPSWPRRQPRPPSIGIGISQG